MAILLKSDTNKLITRNNTVPLSINIDMFDVTWENGSMINNGSINSSYHSKGISPSYKITYMYTNNSEFQLFYHNNIIGDANKILCNDEKCPSTVNKNDYGEWSIPSNNSNFSFLLPGLQLFKNIDSRADYTYTKRFFDDRGFQNNYYAYFWITTGAVESATGDDSMADFSSDSGWEYEEDDEYKTYGPGWWEGLEGVLAWGHYNMLRCDSALIKITGSFPADYRSAYAWGAWSELLHTTKIGFCFPSMIKTLYGINYSGASQSEYGVNYDMYQPHEYLPQYNIYELTFINDHSGTYSQPSDLGFTYASEYIIGDDFIQSVKFSYQLDRYDFLGHELNKNHYYPILDPSLGWTPS